MTRKHLGPIDYLECKKNLPLWCSALNDLGVENGPHIAFRISGPEAWEVCQQLSCLPLQALMWSAVWRGALCYKSLSCLVGFSILCSYCIHIIWLNVSSEENKEQQCCSHTLSCTVLPVANFMQTDILHLLTNWEIRQNLDSCSPH